MVNFGLLTAEIG